MTHTEIDYSKLRPTDWLPTSVKEMKALGWESVDVVIFRGTPMWTTRHSGPP